MGIKFGVQIVPEALSYEEIRCLLVNLGKRDFYSFLLYDHFHQIWSSENTPNFENWVLLSALSREPSEIRIGTLVNSNTFRFPSVLAKMAASLDVLSGGRLEFMIGAGNWVIEHKGYGIPFPRPRVRIEQLHEAIEIIKLMWTEHKTYFTGKYYQLDGAICYPKPLQKPYPRIWVGGSGEKYTLRTVAAVGEGTNLRGTPDDIKRKLNLLRKYCDEVGRNYDSIEKSWFGDVVVGRTKSEVKRGIKAVSLNRLPVHGTSGPRPGSLIGTPSQIIDMVEEYTQLGVNYFILVPTDRTVSSILHSMNLFSEKVVAAFT